MGDRSPQATHAAVGALALSVMMLAGAFACGGGDGDDDSSKADGSTDAGADTDADADAGGDGGADAGGDGGTDGDGDGDADGDMDGDTDSDTDELICDPRACDDGCFTARKKMGECIDGLCVCSGDRSGGCSCQSIGAVPTGSFLTVLLAALR
jgi:hypothetical protein